ncbi:protein nirH [Halovibrio salipaludis]|uniref:siroheme decarboxylase n=1 Tax=Halovibrio salipaludis TaxID=2032626 RepID=A0A2A2F8D5_9GAMM|nr:Lrp/AsnC family transcriptional regulator [Halovibrio salipaludis]PAU81706.1 protein nirH [Halovibrio salipaludis]
MSTSASTSESTALGSLDRELIVATQQGLPLVSNPWEEVGERIGISGDEALARFQRLQANGVLRRVAAVPNHYRLGYHYNGMTVWDVDDEQVRELGQATGELPFVSHCYRRPRHRPLWPYNLFAMVHGTSRDEVETKAERIHELLGDACRGHQILYSSAILKKTGLRLQRKR